jgi:type IV secretion system protein VirB2
MSRNLFRVSAVLFAVLVVTQELALAEGAGIMPYEPWLKVFRESVTGPVAAALIIVGIVGAGAMLVWGGEIGTFLKSMIYLTLVACFLVGSMSLYEKYFGGTGGYSLRGDYAAESVLEPGKGR